MLWVFAHGYHVEAEFETFVASRKDRTLTVRDTRCVGKSATGIKLRPILYSRLTGSYPFLDERMASVERSYMEVTYWHGYWFNYCKTLVQDGSEELVAYWSLAEDRWHLVRWKDLGPRWGWEEVDE